MGGSIISRTLIDGGSGLNVIFAKTLQMMGLDLSKALTPGETAFYDIIPGNAAIPLGQITLPVTFGTRENYRTEFIKFEVVDFSSSYNAILGCPAMAKFMAIPHYVYLLLKMPVPNGAIAIKGDLKKSYECDNEAVDYAMKAAAEAEQKVLLAHAATPPSAEPDMPSKKSSKDKARPANLVLVPKKNNNEWSPNPDFPKI
ncbi:unnamed protein product [Urochloa humidicola]